MLTYEESGFTDIPDGVEPACLPAPPRRVGAPVASRITEDQQWWKRYNEYLSSPAWKAKARFVLTRDPICQGCGVASSVQVHHTTYKHIFHEPLFELVALCVKCHDEITAMDRARQAAFRR